MAFTEDSTKHKKVHSNVSSLGEVAHRMPLQMELYESAQHGNEWISRPQHNAQIPSAPAMSFVSESL